MDARWTHMQFVSWGQNMYVCFCFVCFICFQECFPICYTYI